MLNSVRRIVNSTAKYLYHGAFDGFLITGGFAFYALFLLGWPMTPLFQAIFTAATLFTTAVSLYLRYRDNRRTTHYNSMNSSANEIMHLVAENQYYIEKLIEEQQLLKMTASTRKPIHRTISESDHKRFQQKAARLKCLIQGGEHSHKKITGLDQHRKAADAFISQYHQRHIIGFYKALVTAYVFYGSFPLFVMLAINAIIAPTWIPLAVMPVLIYSGVATAFGLIRSYMEEARKVSEFDSAILESKWIGKGAMRIANRVERYSEANQKKITALKRAKQFFPPTDEDVLREDQQNTKNPAHFLIKDFNKAHGAELRARVPKLPTLLKKVGQRHPDSVRPPIRTLGDWVSVVLHYIAEFLTAFTWIEPLLRTIGRYVNAAICGALVPGGVALFLKFVLNINFTPQIVLAFTGVIIGTTVMSVLFRIFFDARDSRQSAIENLSDFSYRHHMEKQYLLQKLKKEYGFVRWKGIDHRNISADDRDHIKTVIKNSNAIDSQLKAKIKTAERFHNNFFIRVWNAFGMGYHSLVTGYAWYMGFPLFVFLTINAIIFPITSTLAINLTFGFSVAAGLFGVFKTALDEIYHAQSYTNLIDEAKALCDSNLELNKHCDKFLSGSTKDGHMQKSNQKLLKSLQDSDKYHPVSGKKAKPLIHIKQDADLAKKYPFFKAYREPDKHAFKDFGKDIELDTLSVPAIG